MLTFLSKTGLTPRHAAALLSRGDEDLGPRYDCGDTTTDGQDLASKEEKDSLN